MAALSDKGGGNLRLALRAPAKLNLRLHVVGRRADGMHLLEGESVLVDFCDTVALWRRQDGVLRRAWNHPQITEQEDIAFAAMRALQGAAAGKARAGLGASLRVYKKIPLGGGLGGGSSNAACVLLGLNRLWGLRLPQRALAHIAAGLGADAPFFVWGRAAKIGGIGAPVAALTRRAPAFYLLVFPPVVANTRAVYAQHAKRARRLETKAKPYIITDAAAKEAAEHNHLFLAAMTLHPPILQAAKHLRRAAGMAKMSGSGSALFASFATAAAAKRAQRRLPAGLASAVARELPRHPFFCANGE